jgi:glycosyltransferase involved in cell wall biosynthesis
MTGDSERRKAAGLIARADSIYFLMGPGWKTELRSNRWHYASRWARHLPVVLVQPCDSATEPIPVSEVEPRIPNCRVLHVCEAGQENGQFLPLSLLQSHQILADMEQHRYSWPIMWIYYPHYVCTIGFVPALAHIFHATENYFDYPALSEAFLTRLKATLAMSDLVISVSEGVADAYRPYVKNLHVVTNGCDYHAYASGGTDAELAGLRDGYARIAVYAGNVNARLDFDLLIHTAMACPDTIFAFYGPVSGLNELLAQQWSALLDLKNVRFLGSISAERLPAVYGSADIGLMPYVKDRLMVENGFPLKTFEMLAAGLPVVSTHFKSLEQFDCPGLIVTQSNEAFISSVRGLSRKNLSCDQTRRMEEISRRQDYEVKFEAVYQLVDALQPVTGRSDRPESSFFGLNGVQDDCVVMGRQTGHLKSELWGRFLINEIGIARARIFNLRKTLTNPMVRILAFKSRRAVFVLAFKVRRAILWLIPHPIRKALKAFLQ